MAQEEALHGTLSLHEASQYPAEDYNFFKLVRLLPYVCQELFQQYSPGRA